MRNRILTEESDLLDQTESSESDLLEKQAVSDNDILDKTESKWKLFIGRNRIDWLNKADSVWKWLIRQMTKTIKPKVKGQDTIKCA